MDADCPICGETGEDVRVGEGPAGATIVHCPRCGDVELTPEVLEALAHDLEADSRARSALSHHVRRMQRRGGVPRLEMDVMRRLLEEPLPSIVRQREDLVLLVGRDGPLPGESAGLFDARRVQAEIGAGTWRAVGLVGGQLAREGLMNVEWSPAPRSPDFKAALTFDGWRLYEELLEGKGDSRTAFMALQFGDGRLDRMVDEVFRPAVRQTGFELIRVDDVPRAGLIDDHIRVMIRKARFVVADLTHDNSGAYWEAGFAEGLGKPVVFTCERTKFEEDATHFDTSHQHTVTWAEDRPGEAARDLKATIRATLPSEARLTDPEGS